MHAIDTAPRLRAISGGLQPRTEKEPQVGTVFVVESGRDDGPLVGQVLEWAGFTVRSFGRGSDFLAAVGVGDRGCVVLNTQLPGVDWVAVIEELGARAIEMPVLLSGGHATRPVLVQPLRGGRPNRGNLPLGMVLMDQVGRALEVGDRARGRRRRRREARDRLRRLSRRQLQVAQRVVAGEANKVIAGTLNLSERTVEVHRARVMRQARCESVAGLVWLFCQAGFDQGVGRWPIEEFRRQLEERE